MCNYFLRAYLPFKYTTGLESLEDAKVLAARCRRILSRTEDSFERSMLIEALARFFARTHDWSVAIELWRQAPLEQPFRGDALRGIVQLHLACAFECVEIGLRKLAELKENPDGENELCLPGNDLALTTQAERKLLKFRRGIENLLPDKVRKELGVMTQNELFAAELGGENSETSAEN